MATPLLNSLSPLLPKLPLFLHNNSSLGFCCPKLKSGCFCPSTCFKLKATVEESRKVSRDGESVKKSVSEEEDVTEKFGLEAGLWKIFSSKEQEAGEKSKGDKAKELLGKYGGAYLTTSITLSIISFALCYVLVSSGVDVQALLSKIGISASETNEKVGTFALAYAAHKAASPIRFPPTVALTPIVATWIGKIRKKD